MLINIINAIAPYYVPTIFITFMGSFFIACIKNDLAYFVAGMLLSIMLMLPILVIGVLAMLGIIQ